MRLADEMNRLYYRMAVCELQITKGTDLYRGMTYHHLLYLNIIAETEECTVGSLARLLGVTPPAVTATVNDLVRRGAVRKTPSSRDRRIVFLTLSPSTEQTLNLYDDVFRSIERKLKKTYSEDQLELFGEILKEIADCDWRNVQTEF